MYPLLLETPRLILREFEDADHVATNAYESDLEVLRYWSIDRPQSLAESLASIRKVRAESSAAGTRTVFELAAVTREDQRVIGKAGLAIRRPAHREAELWYTIRRDCWGRGYAVEAAQAMLDFGFGKLALHRIYADADPRNIASVRVAEKVGMQREGVLRENWFIRGDWCDSVISSILEHEWSARRGQ